jgi:hypothetical protein
LAAPAHAAFGSAALGSQIATHTPLSQVWLLPQPASVVHADPSTQRPATHDWPAAQSAAATHSVAVVQTPVRTVESPVPGSSGNVAMRSNARCGT